jgi:hypothetical protein
MLSKVGSLGIVLLLEGKFFSPNYERIKEGSLTSVGGWLKGNLASHVFLFGFKLRVFQGSMLLEFLEFGDCHSGAY